MGATKAKFKGEASNEQYLQTALENKECRNEIKERLRGNEALRT